MYTKRYNDYFFQSWTSASRAGPQHSHASQMCSLSLPLVHLKPQNFPAALRAAEITGPQDSHASRLRRIAGPQDSHALYTPPLHRRNSFDTTPWLTVGFCAGFRRSGKSARLDLCFSEPPSDGGSEKHSRAVDFDHLRAKIA